MIILTGIIESGGSFMDGVKKVQEKLPETMLYSWSVWPIWVVLPLRPLVSVSEALLPSSPQATQWHYCR